MTLILTADGPADMLAMVPALVGFTPRNSIVLVAFRGKRTCGAIRFDLPESTSRTVHKRIATSLTGTLCKLPGVDSVVPVICTDNAFGGGSAVPHSEFASALNRRLEQSGFHLRQSLCHAADGWASYLDPHTPAGGHPLTQIAGSSVVSAIPDDWRRASDIHDLPIRIPDADPSTMARFAAQLAGYHRAAEVIRRTNPDEFDSTTAQLVPLSDIPRLAEEALGWDAATTEAKGGLLLFAVQGPPTRDLVMLQWATRLSVGDQLWGGPRVEGSAECADDVDLGDLMMGIAPRPNPDRIKRGIELLTTLVSWAADTERPAPLCMLAWLNWALGSGSRAGRHLDEVRAIDPGYTMGRLLETMFGNGRLPDWAFADPAAR